MKPPILEAEIPTRPMIATVRNTRKIRFFMRDFFPDFKNEFRKILDAINGEKIAIVGHMRPDGDCVSSQFVLADIFRGAGAKEVVCVNRNPVPYLYEKFICGEKMLSAEDFADETYKIVTVDCADYKRTDLKLCERFPRPLACIDHHATNLPYADFNIIDPKASATAELLAGLAFDAGIKLSRKNADRLYMGIVMDTRQFTTSSTRASTFETVTELVKIGANVAGVAVELYQRERFGKLKLLARYIETLKLYENGRICIGYLPDGVFAETGSEKADSDGLVDYARSVNGVDIAALLETLPNGVKGSLRAKSPDLRVDKIAQVFGGGGHFAAAGFTATGETLESLAQKLVELAAERLRAFDESK